MADEMMTPAAPAEGAEPAEYMICIKVGSSGIAVSTDAAAPGEAEESAAPASMPVASIKEAVSMVMGIYANDGKMPDADTSDSDFESGFGKKKAAPVDRVRDMEDMG